MEIAIGMTVAAAIAARRLAILYNCVSSRAATMKPISLSPRAFPDPATYEFPEWVRLGEYFYYAKDIVSFGNEPTPDNLEQAYRLGIFPWPIDGLPLAWFCPLNRAVLEFKNLHVPRSLAKKRRKSALTISIDRDFPAVINACAAAERGDGQQTWITSEFIAAYTALHRKGVAHSVEAWDSGGRLVGGLYGVDAGGVFAGESMFHLEADASKLALLFLIDHLGARGATWIDIQVMTPHMEALGATEIGRKKFLRKLKETQARGGQMFDAAVSLMRDDDG